MVYEKKDASGKDKPKYKTVGIRRREYYTMKRAAKRLRMPVGEFISLLIQNISEAYLVKTIQIGLRKKLIKAQDDINIIQSTARYIRRREKERKSDKLKK